VDLDGQNDTGIDGRRCRQAKILPDQVLHVAKQHFHIDYPDPNQQTREADDLVLEFRQGSGLTVDAPASLQSATQHSNAIAGHQQISSSAAADAATFESSPPRSHPNTVGSATSMGTGSWKIGKAATASVSTGFPSGESV